MLIFGSKGILNLFFRYSFIFDWCLGKEKTHKKVKFSVRMDKVLSEKCCLDYFFRITRLFVENGQGIIFLKLPGAPASPWSP